MNEIVQFFNILEPRNTQFGIFKFMTRLWTPKQTFILDRPCTSNELKEIVANSAYITSFIEAMKEDMGKNPILFLPTHRSYADFCVLTYLCYHYDIELPAVAAGMDFYSMAVVGQRMRETGAFYIRRTIAGAPLYAATLTQYVRTLVAKHHAPIEFFIEGTRSRSNKSLLPKYGMLSMSLVPFFAGEVSDITIVPVNFSYERIMEQTLFAYEHIGVPKPKESTGGLLKALRSLNDHFGNIYINFATPISLKETLRNENLVTSELLKPVSLQQLTLKQLAHTQHIAHEVVALQQYNTVTTITNLLSLVLMNSIMKNEPLYYEEILREVEWMIQVLKDLGASVHVKDVKNNVDRILTVHHKLVTLDRERRLRLITGDPMEVTSDVKRKMKGHVLKADTMIGAVAVIQVQIYVNPVLHHFVPPALAYLIVKRGPTDIDKLASDYHQLRKLLKREFYHIDRTEKDTFNKALEYCLRCNVLVNNGGMITVGDAKKLHFVLDWVTLPALTTTLLCQEVMIEKKRCKNKELLKLVQKRAEERARHPYCLSLEATANCLQGLVLVGALLCHKTDKDVLYELVPEVMEKCRRLVSSVLPVMQVCCGSDNLVFIRHAPVACRL
ncbi:dihydroxyacetone phosphate acyltransferase isoform X2 [Battus philenor]|uniref:dihydroxyacetone phosphate acyltransferase isoform X2 n=1 Tax=Battus philenor TaxID=42288 RepID=UPI0035D0A87E